MKIHLVVVLVFEAFLFVDGQSTINAAFRKRIAANITCGSPAEKYFKIQDVMLLPRQRTEYSCDASDGNYSHPPTYMVDGSMATFWQSTARTSLEKDKAYIEIDLQQMFFAYQIKITFGDHQRPGAIAIAKSNDFGASFTPYHYLVSHPETTECRSVFGLQHYSKGVPIDRVDRVLCQHYDLFTALEYNETVTVELNGRLRGDGTPNSHSPGLLAWLNITNLRFTFSKMHLVLDTWSYKFHHYAVREIEVLARCNCNGHSNGGMCPQEETTKKRACQCQGNTCGDNCEICCPLYNQKPWIKGSKAPWEVDPDVSCELCNCHNHSDACVYNQTVSDLGMSLDIHGNKSGGGVCLDCKNHTRGINCEKCEEFYYRPRGRDKTREDACQACSCDVRGTKNITGLTFLDCVPDEEESSNHPGKEPGNCYCKSNVHGKQCDKCNSEYFNLTRDNPDGCSECRCHLPGTINGSNVCNASETGQCPCKTHVELRDCSQCKHGYYNLSNESADGCIPCLCDEGGTYPVNTCDKASGQCQCRANVIGRDCAQVPDGYYYPDLHFIKATRDPYKPVSNNLLTLLHIPKTTTYRLFLKDTEGKLILSSNESITTSFNKTAAELKSCMHDNGNYCLLHQGNYTVNITVYSAKKLDSIVAIPEEFITASVLGASRIPQFKFQCGLEDNDMRQGTSSEKLCLKGTFSLTVAFNNGSLPCSCHLLGSVNHTVCQKYGGSCTCKPGVEGRDCSRCKPGFYNLTGQGCQPCSCNGPNKVCHPVTGMCECPGNTTGRTCEPCQCNNNTNQCLRSGECLGCQYNTTGFYCEMCVNQTYGDASKQQCKACECDLVGSYGSICDITTGQCACKPYATGQTCDKCKNNTYGFGSNGCTACKCSALGSMSLQCNNTGHCTCKPEASGVKCSQCNLGYYGLPTQACQACACNSTGTLNGTVCSNDAYGQCHCKPGVTGRACDRCKEYYTNLSDQGCTSCPACVMKLKKMLNTTDSQLNATEEVAKNLNELAEQHEPLRKAEMKADQLAVKATEFSDRLAEAQSEHQRLNVELPQTTAGYDEQLQKANKLKARAPATAHNVSRRLKRITEVYNLTADADVFVNNVDKLLRDVSNTYASNLQNSNDFLNTTKGIVSDSLVQNYSNHEKLVAQSIKDADNLTAFVTTLARKLLNQTSLARDLNVQIQENNQNLSQLLMKWNATHAEFVGFLASVTAQFGSVHELLNQTQESLTLESQRFREAQELGSQSKDTLNKTKTMLQEATSAFEQYKAMVTSVSGELQVSMLKYDEEGHWFVLKVLEGRNLSPRDLPSGSANPYVLVSLVPGNFGVQRSITMNDTLNPVWPEYSQIYRFNIQQEQLVKSKLKLRVFDYDPEDEDDFMGETTIDLSTLGSQTVTNWYPLRSEDVSQIESGNFKTTSGLADVSNLLSVQHEKVSSVLGSVEVKLAQAHQNAQQLKTLAEQLEVEFNNSRSHGDPALQAVQRYTEIERIINGSWEALSRAQNSVVRIASELNRVSISELMAKATNELDAMSAFYNATLLRNLTSHEKAFIEHAISTANGTKRLAVQQWYEAYNHYPALIEAEAKLSLATSLYAPSAVETITHAQERTNHFSESLTSLSQQMADLHLQLTVVFNKIEFVKNSSERDTKVIQAAYSNVNTTSIKLKNVSSNVLEALKQRQLLQGQQQECDNKLNELEMKLRNLKNRMSEVELGLKMNGEGANEYTLSRRTLESPTRNELLITFKTNSSEGLLLNILGKNVNSHQTGLAVFLLDGKVNVEYNTGQGPNNVTSPVPASNGQWVDAYFTRMGSSSALTVSNSHQSVTRTHNAESGSENATLHLTNTSTVLLGGAASARAAQVNDRLPKNFNGTISSFSIDQSSYHLWKPKTSNGNFVYALPKFPNYDYPNNGQAASFFSNGFSQQESGEFITDSGYSRVEFDFRTAMPNGTLFAVTKEDKNTSIIAIFMQNGRVVVMVLFSDTVLTLTSKSSDYNDGNWYHVSTVVTSTQVFLAVSHDNITDNSSMSTAASRLPPGRFVFFGSLPNSNALLPISESFVGDIKDVQLNRNGTSTMVRRLFSSSRGVSTDGVLKGKVLSGAVRFYGYRIATKACSYVAMELNQSEADNLTFTFKTSERSGVLLYSSINVNGSSIYLYMALWHGKLVFLEHDSANSRQSKPMVTSDMSYNDNMWKTVHFNSSESGYSLFVNGVLVGSGQLHPLRLSKPLYIGGVPNDVEINLGVPVTWCFSGDMKDFKINSNEMDLLSQKSVGVSGGFVSPAAPAPPPTPAPPTCAASAGPLTLSTNPKEIGFTAGFSSSPTQQSYMGFTVDEQLSGISSVFTLELLPVTSNGLVLYIADNLTHPEQFISIEILDGYIKYQVRLNPGHIKMKSSINYVERNQWFKINALRILDFGAFLVPQTKEYQKDRYSDASNTNLKLAGPLYIGGVPSHVTVHPLVTHKVGFSGCLKSLTFGSGKLSSELQFYLQNPSFSSKTSACFSNARPGMGFNGSSWVNFGEASASPTNFSLQFEFRTSTRNGVLVYLFNDSASGQHVYLKLEQISGQLVLSHRSASGSVRQVTWSASSSYLLCNMTWHKLTLMGVGDAFNLTVDEAPAVSLAVSADTTLAGKLYIGGAPGSLSTPESPALKGFLGCLNNLKLHNRLLDFGQAVNARHTTNGCPSTNA